MRKITLLICFVISPIISAQGVYEIIWDSSTNPSVASPIIEVGDTVKWIWASASQKTVTSLPGSREIFDSGILEGTNQTFSYTFQKTGVSEYENEIDPNVKGKITVVGKLSKEDKFVKNLKFFPNPVRNYLTISSPFTIDGYQIYNVLGSLVAEGPAARKTTTVDMTALNSGLYFIKVVSGNLQSTLKVAKR